MAVIPPTLIGSVSSGRNPDNITGFIDLTIAHTVPSGTEALIVGLCGNSFFEPPVLVDWDGTTVPLWWRLGAGLQLRLYVLIKPATGSANIFIQSNTPHGCSLTATVYNVQDFAAIRVLERTADNVTPPVSCETGAYCATTDLAIDMLFAGTNGVVFTPGASQTAVTNQSGLADVGVKMASSVKTPVAYPTATEFSWTFTPGVEYAHYVLVIKGLDPDPPAGVPFGIGCISECMSTDAQPPESTDAADIDFRGRHAIDPNHRRLVVLTGNFDSSTTAVEYVPDGAAALPLTEVEVFGGAAVWMLNSAPVGLGYVRVVPSVRRFFGWAAYSISADGLIGTAAGPNKPLAIPSEAGAFAVDYINVVMNSLNTYAPDEAGQTALFDQVMVGTANQPSAASFQSCAGSSSWMIASGETTTPDWTTDPPSLTGFAHAGFSFIAANPSVTFHEEIRYPVRVRRAPHLSDEQTWLFHEEILIDFESGVGLTTGQGSDPVCELRWSDDGGHTWSNNNVLQIGKKGQYKFRTELRRLGRSRDRIYEVRISDPVKSNLQAAYLTVSRGLS